MKKKQSQPNVESFEENADYEDPDIIDNGNFSLITYRISCNGKKAKI
jgi:hypothetical protein